MRLFFLRHGIAETGRGGMRDFDRALTDEGRAELERVALGLRRLKVAPDVILSSPLVRARQTAEVVAPAIGGAIEIVDELGSGAGFEAFQSLIRRSKQARALMFVGHEPDLSEAAAALAGTSGSPFVLKKAGLIRIDLDGSPELGSGRMRWLLTSRQIALIGAAPDRQDGDDATAPSEGSML